MQRGHVVAVGVGLFLLVAASAAAVGLLVFRIEHTNDRHFEFLVWNLALAWTPLVLAAIVYGVHRAHLPLALTAVAGALWLLFLPNAPYLSTDLIHLQQDSRIPLWYDALLLVTFGVAGMLLAFASVFLVQRVVEERLGWAAGWTVPAAVSVLAGIGVYLGRFLRLNSWDALQHPMLFVDLVRMRLTDPLGNPMLTFTVVLFATVLMVGYLATYIGAHACYWGVRSLQGRH